MSTPTPKIAADASRLSVLPKKIGITPKMKPVLKWKLDL
jgi:hypothetical protein